VLRKDLEEEQARVSKLKQVGPLSSAARSTGHLVLDFLTRPQSSKTLIPACGPDNTMRNESPLLRESLPLTVLDWRVDGGLRSILLYCLLI
jgi:hypothetical protein